MGAPVLPQDEKPVKPCLSKPDTHAKKAIAHSKPNVSPNSNDSGPQSSLQPASSTAACKQKVNHPVIQPTPKLQSSALQQPANQSSAAKPAPSIPDPKATATKPRTIPPSSTSSPISAKLTTSDAKLSPVKSEPASVTKLPPKNEPIQVAKQEPLVATAVQPVAKAVPVMQRQNFKHPGATRPSPGPPRALQSPVNNASSVKTEPSSASPKAVATQPVVKYTPVNTARPVLKAEPQKVTAQSLVKPATAGVQHLARASPTVVRTASAPAPVKQLQMQQQTAVARQVPVKTAAPSTGIPPGRASVQAVGVARPAASATPVRTPVIASPNGPKTSSGSNSQVMTPVRRVPQQAGTSATPGKAGGKGVVRLPTQCAAKQVHTATRPAQLAAGRVQPVVRVAGQPARTTGQTVVRTGGQPILRTNAQAIARTSAQQVVRTGSAVVAQVSRQPATRSVQNQAKPVSQASGRVVPTKPVTAPSVTTSVATNGVGKVVPGAQNVVRRVAHPAKATTAVVRQTVPRATQPGARNPQVIARQTAATVSRPVHTTAQAVAPQTKKTGTQPVARAIPQTTGNGSLSRPGSNNVLSGARVVARGSNGMPTNHTIAKTGSVPVRSAVQNATRAITQHVARAVPHTPGKVMAKPGSAATSQAASKLTPTQVAKARNVVATTQPVQAHTAVHPGVVRAVQKAVLHSGHVVGTGGALSATKPAVQMTGRTTLGTRSVVRPTATTPTTGLVAQRPIQTTPSQAAGNQAMRTVGPTMQIPAETRNNVANSMGQSINTGAKVDRTTPVKKSVTATRTAQAVTPQKRPPPVPPEALAAAMAAAAAVEPTPPFQSRAHPSLTTIKPTIAAPRIAKAPQPSTPARAPQSAPACLPKPATPTSTKPTIATPKVAKAPAPAPTPASTPTKEPSRIPEGMTFLPGEHVTIWNRVEKRKIAGNAAPLGKNVEKYLVAHPDCEVYVDQDEDRPGSRSNRKRPKYNYHTEQPSAGDHVAIWNRVEHRKIAGNAAPLAKNLQSYLKKNPNCEVYDYQDTKRKPRYRGRGRERIDFGAPSEEPSEHEVHNSPLDAWKDLNSYVDNEIYYKTEYEQTAELLLTHGDDDDDVSPLILTGPLGVEEPHVMIDLDKFINTDAEDVCEPLGDLLDENLPPLKGSLEVPNSI